MAGLDFLNETSVETLDTHFGAYEQAVLRTYVLNALLSGWKDGCVRISEELLQWLVDNAGVLRIRIPSLAPSIRDLEKGKFSGERTIRISRNEIEGNFRNLPRPSALQLRLNWVIETLKLDAREAMSLSAVCRLTQVEQFRAFASTFNGFGQECNDVSSRVVGLVTGLRGGHLRKTFHPRGQLVQLGLIEANGDFVPSDMLLSLLRQRTTDHCTLENALIGQPLPTSLVMSDFDHIGSSRDDVIRILRGALADGTEGVGLLFHGPPGTGKTEFAKLLAEACSARIVFAGEMDSDEREPRRSDRLAHLALLSAIGRRAGRLIVVVDEADDVFAGVDEEDRARRTGSKVFINRLVESCAVPTVWVTNHPGAMGGAVIRRMLRAVEFRMPGPEVRQRMVVRHAEKHGVEIDSAHASQLAALDVSPAVLASSMKAARLGTGDGDMALAAARSIQVAMGGGQAPPALSPAIAFDPALSSADLDLVRLEERVVRSGPAGLSFLFSGLPGTGKTAFARHLARRLGLDILQKRASDLLGMYVGQTEDLIAKAFQEAADSNRFLIFDEADSLLLDRRGASRSWEVSQVNEMLTWMETHPLPFAATSNLLDRLDPAVQRRFLFKVQFAPMSRAQISLAFQRHFGIAAPGSLLQVENLTPGDFAVVARKAVVLGVSSANELGAMLEGEIALKPGARRSIGFR